MLFQIVGERSKTKFAGVVTAVCAESRHEAGCTLQALRGQGNVTQEKHYRSTISSVVDVLVAVVLILVNPGAELDALRLWGSAIGSYEDWNSQKVCDTAVFLLKHPSHSRHKRETDTGSSDCGPYSKVRE